MSDLISRADAIEALRGLFDMRKSRAKVIVECFSEQINTLPSAEAEWIPCSERLPSESDYYLVTIINAFDEKEVCVIWFAHSYGISEWREIIDSDIVIAWMPLPKPYREDGEA